MARFCGVVMLVVVSIGCSAKDNPSSCELLASPRDGVFQTVVYVHAMGPDYLMAYALGCEAARAEVVKTGMLKKNEGILYIIKRSEAGYSVPYKAYISYEQNREVAVVTLIKREHVLNEAPFNGESPPSPSYSPTGA